MNKSTKGAIAASAAAALLLGGAGSLAYWNSESTVEGTSITAGELKLESPSTGTWQITNNGTTTAVADINAVRIVPGDKLTYTRSWTVKATGQNLKADVDVTGLNGSGTLASHVTLTDTYELSTTVGGSTFAAVTNDRVTSSDNGKTLRAKVAVDLPFNATPTDLNNDSQAKTLDLTKIKVVLKQAAS